MKSFIVFFFLVACCGMAMAAIAVARPPIIVQQTYKSYPATYAYSYPQYGYLRSGPWQAGYATYQRYPYAYGYPGYAAGYGTYYPYASTLGGYYSYPVDPVYSNVILKKK